MTLPQMRRSLQTCMISKAHSVRTPLGPTTFDIPRAPRERDARHATTARRRPLRRVQRLQCGNQLLIPGHHLLVDARPSAAVAPGACMHACQRPARTRWIVNNTWDVRSSKTWIIQAIALLYCTSANGCPPTTMGRRAATPLPQVRTRASASTARARVSHAEWKRCAAQRCLWFSSPDI